MSILHVNFPPDEKLEAAVVKAAGKPADIRDTHVEGNTSLEWRFAVGDVKGLNDVQSKLAAATKDKAVEVKVIPF